MVPSVVWVVMGTPVFLAARAEARRAFSSFSLTLWGPVAHLMTPGLILRAPTPSVISVTKISSSSSILLPAKYCGKPRNGPWSV